MSLNVVVIGAGSASFGRGQVVDLLSAPELRGRGVRVVLVDTDPTALDVMRRFAERVKAHTGSDVAVEGTTDRTQALPGANYVVTAVARKRWDLWEQDFRVPLAHGFRHCLGENGGPGALFHALRSFELIMPICRDIERLCPEALMLNFTNPEARVLHAISHLTAVRAAGICHGVFGVLRWIGARLQRPHEDFDVLSAGLNHIYCVLQVREKATGREWLPDLVRMAADAADAPPLFRKVAEVFGVLTFPSDDHIGEYVGWGAEYSGVKWKYGREHRAVTLQPATSRPTVGDYADGRVPLDAGILHTSGEITVPVILDIELNRGSFRHAVNVLNREGYIPNLPREAAVEVPARVDRQGLHPLHVPPIPEAFAAILRTQCTINALVTEAYRTRSRQLLLQALLLDPCVNGIGTAEQMLTEMLDLQREFLPEMK